MLRLIVASDTPRMSISSSNASQCSFKVRPGSDSNSAPAATPSRLGLHRGSGGDLHRLEASAVWCLRLSQRLVVERETPKSSQTSTLGMPRSMAESTLSLRSFE